MLTIESIPVYGPGLIEAASNSSRTAVIMQSIPVYGPGLIEASVSEQRSMAWHTPSIPVYGPGLIEAALKKRTAAGVRDLSRSTDRASLKRRLSPSQILD